jgi:hypothetical protein
VLGFTYGAGLASSSGYPNNAQKIDDPSFYAASGLMAGTSSSLFVMGALADYLNFGFWLSNARFSNSDWKSTGTGVGFRVEAFPLMTLYPRLDGLAVFSTFGLGSAKLTPTDPTRTGADGTQSYLGAGAFYEWSFGHVLGGHFGVGPSLEYDAIFSTAIERHGAVAALRVAFYGGP